MGRPAYCFNEAIFGSSLLSQHVIMEDVFLQNRSKIPIGSLPSEATRSLRWDIAQCLELICSGNRNPRVFFNWVLVPQISNFFFLSYLFMSWREIKNPLTPSPSSNLFLLCCTCYSIHWICRRYMVFKQQHCDGGCCFLLCTCRKRKICPLVLFYSDVSDVI